LQVSQGLAGGPHVQDPESLEDVPLVPGMTKTENMLRWGFIKKVYAIIACQVLLTSVVASVIYLVHPIQNFVLSSPSFQITFAILPLVGETPSSASPLLTEGANIKGACKSTKKNHFPSPRRWK